ncbi:MAG: hypothetical protein R6X33_03015 [Candidatus Brocadiia bacterium]
MKKALAIVVALMAALVAFAGSMVVVVNSRGGVPAESPLAGVPVLSALLKVQASPEADGGEEPDSELADLPASREAPFLRFGPEARLQKLARELTVKKAEYDQMLGGLERRERELAAWERQLKKERDDLRETLRRQKEDLALLQEQLQQKEAQLEALQIAIRGAEQENLERTAEIYGKMDSERAAEIFAQMYEDGQQETVVKIIFLMQDRSAAKALAAFSDPKISAQITEQLKRIKESEQQEGGQG